MNNLKEPLPALDLKAKWFPKPRGYSCERWLTVRSFDRGTQSTKGINTSDSAPTFEWSYEGQAPMSLACSLRDLGLLLPLIPTPFSTFSTWELSSAQWLMPPDCFLGLRFLSWLHNYLLTEHLWLSFRHLKLSMATVELMASSQSVHIPRLHEWPSWLLVLLSSPCASPSPAKSTPRLLTQETPSPCPVHLPPFLGPCHLSLDYDNCFLINFQCSSHILVAGATSSLLGSIRSLS